MCLLGVRCDIWARKILFNPPVLANCPRRPLCLALPIEPHAEGRAHRASQSVGHTLFMFAIPSWMNPSATAFRKPIVRQSFQPWRSLPARLLCRDVRWVGQRIWLYVWGGSSFSVQGYLGLEDTWKCGCVVVAQLLKASALSARRLVFSPHHTSVLSQHTESTPLIMADLNDIVEER